MKTVVKQILTNILIAKICLLCILLKTKGVFILLHKISGWMEKVHSATETSTQGYLLSCNANSDNFMTIVKHQEGMACLFAVTLGSLDAAANFISRSSYLHFQDAEALHWGEFTGVVGVDIKE